MFLLTVTTALATLTGAFFMPRPVVYTLLLVTVALFTVTVQVWFNTRADEWEKADDQ